jgi:hypothetical protein
MLRLVALVRTDVSEERSASFMRVTRIGEQGTKQNANSTRNSEEGISSHRASVASCS